MTERPILFSTPMVRAILEGRKTQTRRALSPQPVQDKHPPAGWEEPAFYWRGGPKLVKVGYGDEYVHTNRDAVEHAAIAVNPYGSIGDVLWVREAWRPTGICAGQWTSVLYRADEKHLNRPYFKTSLAGRGWRPGIHLPRSAARLFLKITDIRVERLQEISEREVRAEGLFVGARSGRWTHDEAEDSGAIGPIAAFRRLWDSLNGHRGLAWAANPWVYVVSFKRRK